MRALLHRRGRSWYTKEISNPCNLCSKAMTLPWGWWQELGWALVSRSMLRWIYWSQTQHKEGHSFIPDLEIEDWPKKRGTSPLPYPKHVGCHPHLILHINPIPNVFFWGGEKEETIFTCMFPPLSLGAQVRVYCILITFISSSGTEYCFRQIVVGFYLACMYCWCYSYTK